MIKQHQLLFVKLKIKTMRLNDCFCISSAITDFKYVFINNKFTMQSDYARS